MLHIAYTHEGRCRVAYLHYATGTLDWRKYHLLSAEHHAANLDDFGSDYDRRAVALHTRAAESYDPTEINLGGCENDAGKAGCWQVNTDEEAAAWVRMVDQYGQDCFAPEQYVLHLDFDNKRMTAKADNTLCDWWDYAPDGWDVVLV